MANSKRLRDALLQNSKQAVQSGRSAAAGVSEQSGAVWLPVAEILPDPDQPRTAVDDATLARLVESIRALGQIEPILVEPLRAAERVGDAEAKRYRCLSGHRRLRAHELLGLAEIKATIVRDRLKPSERFMHEIASNEAREDHTDFDRARFLASVFAERLGLAEEAAASGEALERVKYLVNRAFNELDRTGALGAESGQIVRACEEALRALGERRNLRWFHRWGLPLLALRGAAREAAVGGLDARRALTLAQLAPRGSAGRKGASAAREGLIAELAAIVRRGPIGHRDLAGAVREISRLAEAEGESAPRVRSIVAALARDAEEAEKGSDAAERSARQTRRSGKSGGPASAGAGLAELRERTAALSARWSVTLPDSGRAAKGARRATPIDELLAGAPESERRRADRLVRALERADRELAALLAAREQSDA